MLKGRMVVILLLISVLANFGLAYRVFDLGVTITYGNDELARRGRQVEAMQKLFPAVLKDRSRSNLTDVAGKLGLEVLDKGDEGVYIDGVQFIFSGDQVSAVDSN